MSKTQPFSEKNKILNVLKVSACPLAIGDIDKQMAQTIHKKTLQRRLNSLVKEGLVISTGEKKGRKYALTNNDLNNGLDSNFDRNTHYKALSHDHKSYDQNNIKENDVKQHPIFSKDVLSLLHYLQTPSYAREKQNYQTQLITNYTPNQTQYVPNAMREKLYLSGKRFDKALAAGTYAKHIGQRLLIDLSYHSSRLEGNTYSKLDTQKLIEKGLTAKGKVHEETIMIMNHKEAILFLVENADELVISPFVIRNIHYILAQDLLNNPLACGNIRQLEVNIGKSSYLPLNNAYQLEENFTLMLRKAAQIKDPFEQSFFLFIHISYIQAFEDVNKRTARLACNIPFVQKNLCPLSFIDVPQEDYFKALLFFYEKNDIRPALELYQWAYLQSCKQYDAVKISLGNIDAYRVQYRAARKEIISYIIRNQITGDNIEQQVISYCQEKNIAQPDKFLTMVIQEINTLHTGTLVSLGLTESMFSAWQAKNS